MKNSAFLLSGQLLLFHSMKAIMKGLMSTKFWDGVTTQEIDTLYFSAVPTPERVTRSLKSQQQRPKSPPGYIAT